MKPKYRGWKEGILSQDIRSWGGTVHRKGDLIRYKRKKAYGEDGYWTGKFEWHYLNTDNYELIRLSESEFFIEGENGD